MPASSIEVDIRCAIDAVWRNTGLQPVRYIMHPTVRRNYVAHEYIRRSGDMHLSNSSLIHRIRHCRRHGVGWRAIMRGPR